jgi:pimeloyl-ACP methyl ester carboxylesterase
VTVPRRVLSVPVGDDVVAVEVSGELRDGRPVVALLHGSGGNRATWWQQVVRLVDAVTVVTLDLRGSGRSTDLAEAAGPVQWAADLEAVRRALGVEAWHVVGHSSGGWPALRWAVEHPSRCRSVVVLSSLAGVFPPAAEEHWVAFTAGLASQGWADPPLARPLSLTPAFCDAHPDRAHLYQLVASLNPPPSATSPAARVREHDLDPSAVRGSGVLASFVTGELDAIAPPGPVRAAAEACGASFVELPGAGHLALWEDPDGLDPLLRALLG